MATFCDICGHRDNEVKSGGGMEDKGRKITLTVENRDDMSRDILKVRQGCWSVKSCWLLGSITEL